MDFGNPLTGSNIANILDIAFEEGMEILYL
ncbi:MAG: hypothetical protein JWP81_736 [Ferruginibacter sp.]|nr:hypothetical protein [Ferruginibacter sp.]